MQYIAKCKSTGSRISSAGCGSELESKKPRPKNTYGKEEAAQYTQYAAEAGLANSGECIDCDGASHVCPTYEDSSESESEDPVAITFEKIVACQIGSFGEDAGSRPNSRQHNPLERPASLINDASSSWDVAINPSSRLRDMTPVSHERATNVYKKSPSGSPHIGRRELPSTQQSGQSQQVTSDNRRSSTQPGNVTGKARPDGDDPPGKPPGTTGRRARKNESRQIKYTCVYYGSAANDVTSDCATRKSYVSQLRRHHERHDFFYCSNCFIKFHTSAERDAHGGDLCVFLCVTSGCHNYGQSPFFLQTPCSHRRENSQKDQWRQLFRMARPNDGLPSRFDDQPPGAENHTPSVPTQQPLPQLQIPLGNRRVPIQPQPSERTLPTLLSASALLPYDRRTSSTGTSEQSQSSTVSKLVETADGLALLADRLAQTESSLNLQTRQTIDLISQHIQLSLDQLGTVVSPYLMQAESDFTMYPPSLHLLPTPVSMQGSTPGVQIVNEGRPAELDGQTLSLQDIEQYEEDDPGLDCLGLTPAGTNGRGDPMFDD